LAFTFACASFLVLQIPELLFEPPSPLWGRRIGVGGVACYRYVGPLGLKTQAAV